MGTLSPSDAKTMIRLGGVAGRSGRKELSHRIHLVLGQVSVEGWSSPGPKGHVRTGPEGFRWRPTAAKQAVVETPSDIYKGGRHNAATRTTPALPPATLVALLPGHQTLDAKGRRIQDLQGMTARSGRATTAASRPESNHLQLPLHISNII